MVRGGGRSALFALALAVAGLAVRPRPDCNSSLQSVYHLSLMGARSWQKSDKAGRPACGGGFFTHPVSVLLGTVPEARGMQHPRAQAGPGA